MLGVNENKIAANIMNIIVERSNNLSKRQINVVFFFEKSELFLIQKNFTKSPPFAGKIMLSGTEAQIGRTHDLKGNLSFKCLMKQKNLIEFNIIGVIDKVIK